MKKILVLGGGGFIGGHLAKKLKDEGCWVRICDVKKHEYFEEKDILLDPYLLGVWLGDETSNKSIDLIKTHQRKSKCLMSLFRLNHLPLQKMMLINTENRLYKFQKKSQKN